jgi:hypothetical protein
MGVWVEEKVPKDGHTSEDWYNRGLLAERLQLWGYCELAYRNSIALGFHVGSLLRLVELKSRGLGRDPETKEDRTIIEDCLILMNNLIHFYLREEVQAVNRSSWYDIHPIVRESLWRLIAQYGLQHVRSVLHDMPSVKFKPRSVIIIQELMMEAVKWRSKGYDK